MEPLTRAGLIEAVHHKWVGFGIFIALLHLLFTLCFPHADKIWPVCFLLGCLLPGLPLEPLAKINSFFLKLLFVMVFVNSHRKITNTYHLTLVYTRDC